MAIALNYTELRVLDGCKDHGVRANQIAKVITAVVEGSHIRFTLTIDGVRHRYLVRPNRINEPHFVAHKGNSQRKVVFAPVID